MSPAPSNRFVSRFLGATCVVVIGSLFATSFWQTCLSSKQLSSNFVSTSTWLSLAVHGQVPATITTIPDSISLPFFTIFAPSFLVAFATWFAGASWLSSFRKIPWNDALIRWGYYGWFWWCLADLWEWLWIAASAIGWTRLVVLLSVTPQFWLAACLSGWITTLLSMGQRSETIDPISSRRSQSIRIWLAACVYFLVFTTMNWRLYFNLLVPHGDSVMYEEHLWNLLHGKGFRSYLDQGLFLGEHIQFVHLFLLPLYVIWPSHLILEACSSAALSLGVFPVYWMVRRQTSSDRAAFACAVAYLLYFPMQFLDIEIDLKTFRPESFGIPLLLLTLDQLDRRSLIGTLIGIVFCLTVKEDYSIIFGPLGILIALSGNQSGRSWSFGKTSCPSISKVPFQVIFGIGLSSFSVGYLWFATRIIMPWFRSGAEVHYASYFARFGASPEEIVRTMVTHPGLVLDALFTPETVIYAIALLAPVAFLPLLAMPRLAVGLPLFAILCLNELEGSRTPQHQFHAPLVAIIFWSLSAALPKAAALITAVTQRFGKKAVHPRQHFTAILGHLIWTSALATGIFFSLGPLGISFWDPGSMWNWKNLYAPSHRAEMFARISNSIPHTSRVASTDFVHPRFTHHDRSYDYSGYHRKVSGEGQRIPEDTDYLVIDTQHRYNTTIKKPADVPEFRDHPDRWELLPDVTEGYYIVLKRKKE